MAFGKTPEQRAMQEQQRAAEAFWTSPVGRAAAARQQGHRFFQIEVPHSTVTGYSNLAWGSGDVSRVHQHNAAPDLLGQIEEQGWQLQHASWVFVETGLSSRDKMMSSGQATTVTGQVVGIYLFRAR